MTLPRPRPRNATFSGHGGEIAHGFFYKNERQLKKVSRRKKRIPDRIMRFFTKDHEAARPEAYEAALGVVNGTLDAGRDGRARRPVLLDWFYLTDRFAHRSGLATDSERISVFATPGFVRASFALEPEDRLTDRLHLDLIGRLVPEWRDHAVFRGAEGEDADDPPRPAVGDRARRTGLRGDPRRRWLVDRDLRRREGEGRRGGSCERAVARPSGRGSSRGSSTATRSTITSAA